MISFRFHVVSITAVFLAIAIGVLIGSTYVDGAVVDGLRNRISAVSSNLDERQRESDQLRSELNQNKDFIAASADFAVTDRLTDVPVLLLAVRGVDEAAVEEAARLAGRAGASTPGVVWLEPRWADEGERAALAEIVHRGAGVRIETLWQEAWGQVAAELQRAADVPTGEATTETAPLAVLGALESAGFLTVDPLDGPAVSLVDLAGTGPRLVLLGGTEADERLVGLAPVVVTEAVAGGLPTVVGHLHVEVEDGPSRSEGALAGLTDEVLGSIAVVDDVDQPNGQVAVVLAADAVADGVVGHYGLGDGADGILPPWTSP